MYLLLPVITFIAGILILGLGAHIFVKNACRIAAHFHMPPLITGIVLVGFGGSFPEIVVSFMAALHGQSGMALGNAVGSNIVNLGLVLGVSVLLAPIAVHRSTLTRDFPILWIVMWVVGGLLAWTHQLNSWVGIALIIGLMLYLWIMVRSIKKHKTNKASQPVRDDHSPLWRSGLFWVIGLGLLFLSSEIMVSSASTLARHFGMSDLLIGLTIVAIGTSLPEFATTAFSAIKGHHDIALGNVLGSNVFNLLAVLAMPALFSPTAVPHSLLMRDYPVMCLLTLIAMFGAALPRSSRMIGRPTGLLLLLVWIGYYWLLF